MMQNMPGMGAKPPAPVNPNLNLVQAQELFKKLPDDAIQSRLQDPKLGFLALAEVNRRKEMRDRFAAQGQPQGVPPTIASQLVQQAGLESMPPTQPEPMPQEAPMEAGLGSLDAPNMGEGFAGGGVVAFAKGGDEGMSQEEFDKLSPEQKQRYVQIENDRRGLRHVGAGMAAVPAGMLEAVSAPYNLAASGLESVANAVGIPRLGRALGIYDPDVTSVEIPKINPASSLIQGMGDVNPVSQREYRDKLRKGDPTAAATNTPPPPPPNPKPGPTREAAERLNQGLGSTIAPPPVAPAASFKAIDTDPAKYFAAAKDLAGPAPANVSEPQSVVKQMAEAKEYANKQEDPMAPYLKRIQDMQKEPGKASERDAWIRAGLGMLQSQKRGLAGIAEGASTGYESYKAAQQADQDRKEKLMNAEMELVKAQDARKRGDRDGYVNAMAKYQDQKIQAHEANTKKYAALAALAGDAIKTSGNAAASNLAASMDVQKILSQDRQTHEAALARIQAASVAAVERRDKNTIDLINNAYRAADNYIKAVAGTTAGMAMSHIDLAKLYAGAVESVLKQGQQRLTSAGAPAAVATPAQGANLRPAPK
jgi:hypothetical protein